jgi:O-antigen/teichoic acid export membrane protein
MQRDMINKIKNLDFLKSKFITQIFWVIAGLGAAQGLRLLGNLVLTRMLNPGDFGLLAIATSILVGVNMFSDVGLGGTVIRSNKTDKLGYMETIWTLSAIRGVGIGFLLLFVAYPVSLFYGHPELVYIIVSYTAISIAMGCASTNLWLHDKKLDLRKRIINEFCAQLFAIVVMIIWAWISPTYWALVAGAVSSGLFFSIFSHVLYKGNRPKIQWDKEAISEVFHYGKWIFPATAVTYVASQGDRLIMGAVLAIEQVGIYTIAATFASLVTMIISKITMRVLQPLFKQYHDKNNTHDIKKVRFVIVCASAAVCILIAIWGDKIIECLYDANTLY